MVDQKVVDWVKGELAKGRQSQDVSAAMIKAGWKQPDVDAALSAARPVMPVQASQPVAEQEVVEKPKFQFTTMHMIITVVICVLVLIGLAVYKFLNP